MSNIRELGPDETHLAYAAMLELRPHLTSQTEFVERVNTLQRPQGYRLIGSFAADDPEAVAAAGFRFRHALSWGHVLYVDDLITRAAHRGGGHAGQLMDWLNAEAARLGCDQLHLDSGVQRLVAHRFYFGQGLHIAAYHFQREVKKQTE